MKDFADKVAVITGAASGIGRALARKALELGCSIALADIEETALEDAEADLKGLGHRVLAVRTDVSQAEDVERLAQAVWRRFGAVHLLFNNAGVGMPGPRLWERTLRDWEWVLGVNLWGVIHGLHVFLPSMMSQQTECHIVNTASAAGLLSPPGFSAYNASKHAVVTISQTLHHELAERSSGVKVSVFCPGLVSTRIMDSSRNRPVSLVNEPSIDADRKIAYARLVQGMRASAEKALPAHEAAEIVFNAIREETFYVFSHAWVKEGVRVRMQDILEERPPTSPAG